jgi:hypothetical protein
MAEWVGQVSQLVDPLDQPRVFESGLCWVSSTRTLPPGPPSHALGARRSALHQGLGLWFGRPRNGEHFAHVLRQHCAKGRGVGRHGAPPVFRIRPTARAPICPYRSPGQCAADTDRFAPQRERLLHRVPSQPSQARLSPFLARLNFPRKDEHTSAHAALPPTARLRYSTLPMRLTTAISRCASCSKNLRNSGASR